MLTNLLENLERKLARSRIKTVPLSRLIVQRATLEVSESTAVEIGGRIDEARVEENSFKQGGWLEANYKRILFHFVLLVQ